MMTASNPYKGQPMAQYGAKAYAGLSAAAVPNPFPRQMGPNCMTYLQEVIDSGLTSDMVERFERRFADALGMKHCIGTSGCTPALAVIAAALALDPGDEIIVSPVTDFGTIQGLCKQNYIPVFPDTAPGSLNMSAETIEPCVTDRTRAILVVHKSGIVCDMDEINALAARRSLMVYEDACQALFGRYKGRLVGTLSRATAFSFDPEKTLGSDIGGAIVTNDDELAERMRFVGIYRAGVMRPHFGRVYPECGYAYRMPQMTAAVCLAQLETIQGLVANRDRTIRKIYRLLAEIGDVTPLAIPDYVDVHSCWMGGFSIGPGAFRCSTEEFAAQVEAEGIGGMGIADYYLMSEAALFLQRQAAEKTYPFSMPPASRAYRYSGDDCPTARAFLSHFVRWVISDRYTDDDCARIADAVRTVADRNRKSR
jgi:perosamine synthetase